MEKIKTSSYSRGIIVSTIFNILARLLQFLFSIIIGYYFGTQAKTDVFFFMFTSISLLSGFINALDLSVIIPEAMRLKEQESEGKSRDFLNFFLFVYLIIGALFTVILLIKPIELVNLFTNFDSTLLVSNYYLLILTIPLFLLTIITSYLGNILFSYKYFTIPMIINIINAVVSIFTIVVAYKTMDIMSILAGLLIGYSINLVLLILVFKFRLRWKFAINKKVPGKKVLSNIFYSELGNFVNLISSFAPLYLLSGLSTGIITAFNYGQRVANIPADFIVTQWTNVIGIKFNELYTRKDFEQLNQLFISTSGVLLFILIPISSLCFLYGDEIISILFQRGAFNEQSVQKTALFFKFLAFLPPLFSIVVLTSKLFMAGQKIKESFRYQTLFCLLFLVLYYVGVRYLGEKGFLYGILTGYILNLLSIYLLLKFHFPLVQYYRVLRYFGLILIINTLLFFLIRYLKLFLPFNEYLNLAIGIVLYIAIIWVLNAIFKLNKEIHYYSSLFFSKLKAVFI